MHIQIKSIILLSFFSFIIIMAGGCGRGQKQAEGDQLVAQSDSLPSQVKNLVKVITDNDSDGFASIVSYPLSRPYPLRNIEDADQMRGYYKEMVDDSLRNVISHSRPANWEENGWKGWSLDNGQYVWVDESVYDVPYVSQKEQHAIDSLLNEEINSLPESIREGWKPVLCLLNDSDGHVYRIDKRKRHDSEPHAYRMAVYHGRKHLREIPAELLEGDEDLEGTAQTVVYKFTDKRGRDIYVEPDAPDTGTPVLMLPNDSTIELQRAYWHELIRPDK